MAVSDRYFPHIATYTLPEKLLEETLNQLRMEGQYRVESIVFWAGHVIGSSASITEVLIPKGKGVFHGQAFQRVCPIRMMLAAALALQSQ